MHATRGAEPARSRPRRQPAARRWLRAALLATALLAVACVHAQEPDWIYVVRPQDTLLGIAQELLSDTVDWRRLAAHNGIANPRRVPIGQRLRIPVSWLRRQPAAATVDLVRGTARVTSAAGAAPATPGMLLGPGAVLSVEAGGSVRLRFADGSTLTLAENSQLSLDTLSTLATTGMVDTRLRLQRGRAEAEVTPLRGPGSRFEIETPTASAAVRGTQFRAAAPAGGAVSRSEVLDGTVAVAAAGAQVAVPAGFGTVVEAGKPPTPPRALLPAPALPVFSAPLTQLPVRFAWPALAGAASYRVRLVPSGAQPGTIREFLVAVPELVLDDLANGDYQLAVRGIDAVGLEGFEATTAVVVQARLATPQAIAPAPDALERVRSPRLQWSPVDGARGYRVTLEQADSSAPVGQWEVAEPASMPPQPLPEGAYRWRVEARDARGGWSEASAVRGFRVKDPLRSPPLSAGDDDEPGLLRWSRGRPDQTAHVQVARDAAFTDLVLEQTLDADAWTLPPLPPGAYFARVQAIDADGEHSPFGPAKTVVIPYPPLPEAPRLVAPASGLVTRACRLDFEWQPAARAKRYTFTLAHSTDGSVAPITVRAIETTRYRLERPLTPGRYDWTVAASDEYDRDGPAAAPAQLECRAEPPRLAVTSATVERRDVELRWPAAPAAAGYELQIARDPAFTDVALEIRSSANALRWPHPDAGQYHARVRVVEADGYTGEFGPATAVEVKSGPSLWPLLLLLLLIPLL